MGALNAVKNSVAVILIVLVASIMLIVLGLIYFVVTLWVIKFGADIMDLTISGDFAILSASLITLGALAGSALARGEKQ